MHVTDNFDDLAKVARKVCLAAGVFDGVHRGHQKVIAEAVGDARGCGGSAVVLTFDPHPARVLRPTKAPPLLTSTPHKLHLIESLGVDACIVLKFDHALAETEPEVFLDRVCNGVNGLREICVGFQWCFGKGRRGTVALIEKIGRERGFVVKEMEPVMIGTEIVSSTLSRHAVAAGALEHAATLLGRPYSILGTVEVGDRRGRELGFPTANLNPHHEALPPDGVYAVRARFFGGERGGRLFEGVLNIGLRPTVKLPPEQKRTVELHLFDVSEDLYGRDIEVIFDRKIRDERSFESVDALKSQIAADCAAASAILSTTHK